MEISCNHLYESPIGSLQLCATSEGICAVKWLKSGEEREEVEDEETRSDGDKNYTIARQHIASCTRWLDTYFSGSLLKSPVPRPRLVLPMKSSFFHRVWTVLCNTNVGETVSYGELASLAKRPKAARAVGQAVRKHSIPILVPCHRVVRSGRGGMGNYSGGDGPSTKQWLLEHERKMADSICNTIS